jgi:hypothetical protein
MHVEIANSDFPIPWEPLIVGGTGGTDLENRGFGVRGFQQQGTLCRGFAIREIPKVTWQSGAPIDGIVQVAFDRESAHRHSGFGTQSSDSASGDIPKADR